METHIEATEDALLESLSFNLPNSSNYILDRRMVSFFPQGGNEFSPRGAKVIKFVLTGTDWLDPQSLRIQFRVNNRSATTPMHLLNPLPANFFRRLRIIIGGQVVEDIDYYNRVYNTLHTLLPCERRFNDYCEGFGLNHNIGTGPSDNTIPNLAIDFTAGNTSPILPPNKSKVVLMTLLSGLFSQSKCLPLKFMQGVQIEMEVVNSYLDPVAGWTEVEWSLSEPQVKCDLLTLDSSLDNEYTQHLMTGKSLSINFSTFVHQVHQVINNDRPTISMNRAFTRLKRVYVSFFKRLKEWSYNVGSRAVSETQTDKANLMLKECNLFYHPQLVFQSNYDLFTTNLQSDEAGWQSQGFYPAFDTEVETQLQIGSKLIPEMPIRSSSESFYQLRKAIGAASTGSSYALNILDREYRTSKFILCFDCEKTHAAFAGMNTRTGDLITVKVLNFIHNSGNNLTISNTKPEYMHTTLEADMILNITDAGVIVLE